MPGRATPFTNVTNYRLLVKNLQEMGNVKVPLNLREIRAAAQKGGEHLIRWADKMVRREREVFMDALEYYIREGS